MLGNDNMRAIIIPVARVDNVSVASSAFVAGPPGPMALLGLMNKMEIDLREAGAIGKDVFFRSASMIVHEFEIAPGHRRIPPEMRKEAGNKAGAMVDDPEGHLLCTLVFLASTEGEDLESARDFLERNIRRYRLGGGRIVRSGLATKDAGKEEAPMNRPVVAAIDQKALMKIMRVLPHGAVLADRTGLLENKNEDGQETYDGRDQLDRLLDFLALKQRAKKPNPKEKPRKFDPTRAPDLEWYRQHKGWLVPVAIGWRALSDVRERHGMRTGEGVVGHAWVEDVVGLGEWITASRAIGHDGFGQGILWSYDLGPKEGPYLVRGD
jgi:CRISPR type I-F-associated protein Csy2